MSMGTYQVKEITVDGTNKAWGGLGPIQMAGGTVISMTVVPTEEKNSWTVSEAEVVALDVRYHIHKLLIADAGIRKVPPPLGGGAILEFYKKALKILKEKQPGAIWEEKDFQESQETTEGAGSETLGKLKEVTE